MIGDSHGALFGQRCIQEGMIKATYGTGSSIMMNIGSKPVLSEKGIVTSLAWSIDHQVEYVLEGNINYSIWAGIATNYGWCDLHERADYLGK